MPPLPIPPCRTSYALMSAWQAAIQHIAQDLNDLHRVPRDGQGGSIHLFKGMIMFWRLSIVLR